MMIFIVMRVCKRCIQPDTKPGIYFDKQGICGTCIWKKDEKMIGITLFGIYYESCNFSWWIWNQNK